MEDKCYKCGRRDADEICSVCGTAACINCIRVPNPEVHAEPLYNFCIPCYVRAGYGDLWELRWVNPQYGDTNISVFDTPPGIHPFKIPALYGVPARWCHAWKKINDTLEVLEEV